MIDHNIVSVSGGKDSTATLLTAIRRKADNLIAVFADTGHEHPSTYEYVDYLANATGVKFITVKADFSDQIVHKRHLVETKWREDGVSERIIERALSVLHPTGIPFLDICLVKGRFPSRRAQFCTHELKVKPIFEQVFMPLMELPDTRFIFSWQGIRADESAARANLPAIDEVGDGLWNYRPILKLSAGDTFKIHRQHGIKWNPLYEQGMGRVGCMPCINANKPELREIASRFPEEFEKVLEWEQLVSMAAKRGVATFTPARGVESENVSLAKHGFQNTIEWSKTTRGGHQYDLIPLAEAESDTCSSAYGLCG